MKQVLPALFGLILLAGQSSCKKSCHTPGITGVSIWSASGTIMDTSAIVVKYLKTGDFNSVEDTFYNMPVNMFAAPSHIDVGFPVTSADAHLAYNYDWMVILLPSGNTYRIKNISHDNRQIAELSIGMGGRNDATCTNRIAFVVNDVPLTSQDGYVVSSGGKTIALRFIY